MRFVIICTGFNCSEYVKKCLDSAINQTYKNFLLIAISDGSTDDTESEILKFSTPNIISEIHPDNRGAAHRRYFAIHKYANPDDIILLLGMDDEMLPHCLETVVDYYMKGKWMTYGNWIDQRGEMLPKTFQLDFDEETHKNRDYRKVLYRSTCPNTFYQFIFAKIPQEDFMINGKWIDSTTESETMFSCLEMCGKDRIGIVYEPIYLYRKNLPNGTLNRLGVEYKYSIYDVVKSRPKRQLL